MSQKCGKSIDFLILFSSDTNCGFAPDTFSRDKICTYLHKGVYVTAGNYLSDFEKQLLWVVFNEMFRKCWKLAKAQQSGTSPEWNAIPLIFKFESPGAFIIMQPPM